MASWQDWMEDAEQDLAVAENLGRAGFYAAACFHCQQAVEKALKGLLIFKTDYYPKTHALSTLAEKAGVFAEISGLISDIDTDYTLSRYGDSAGRPPFKIYDKKMYSERLANARKAIAEIGKWTKN